MFTINCWLLRLLTNSDLSRLRLTYAATLMLIIISTIIPGADLSEQWRIQKFKKRGSICTQSERDFVRSLIFIVYVIIKGITADSTRLRRQQNNYTNQLSTLVAQQIT